MTHNDLLGHYYSRRRNECDYYDKFREASAGQDFLQDKAGKRAIGISFERVFIRTRPNNGRAIALKQERSS